jgi:pyrimidine deaminase RibD-like protein/FMN phosphatase YigB (HAD superfamily)
MRAREFQPRKLVIFDIDDTLVHTQTKVHVVSNGQVTKSLNSHDFTHYKLQPGEEFDFGDFRDAREFFTNAKPIIPMIDQLKHDIATGNKVVMVTARADFNDRELFLDTFRKYGIDMSKVHVYRAGNFVGKASTEEKKKIIIRNLLDKDTYSKAIMYDDAIPNLEAFVSLKEEYPDTKFYAWHVSLKGEASEFHRTNENTGWSIGYNDAGGNWGNTGAKFHQMESPGDHDTDDSSISLDPHRGDYEIRNYHKLDKYLSELCALVEQGQSSGKDFGMVAAGILPLKGKYMARLNRPGKDGKRIHAEHAVLQDFLAKYGEVPEGTVLLTTLSPCTKHLDERDGPSCSSLVEKYGIKKVYCGYMDPTQVDDARDYNIIETSNGSIRAKCKKFADTFLDDVEENMLPASAFTGSKKNKLGTAGHLKATDDHAKAGDLVGENFADGKNPQDKGDSKRHHVPTKSSVSNLRKFAKSHSGRAAQLAHWMANMKSGHKK